MYEYTIVLDTTPGTIDSNSSVDTEPMAHILENVYNTTYNELIQEKTCAKLKKTSTGTALTEYLKSNLTNGTL